MDCRKSLVLTLGFVGLSSCVGCFGRNTAPAIPPQQQVSAKTTDRPKKAAKSDTWIAYGNFYERSAQSPDVQPAQRQMLLDEAHKSYQKALAVDGKNKDAQLALARLHAVKGEDARAVDFYQKALQKHPKDAAVCFEIGMYHCGKKNWNEALVLLHKAAELEPDNREYVTKYGFTLARAGRFDDGVNCLARVMHKAEAHYNVARMLHHLQQPELCKQHLNVALQTNPNLVPAQQMLTQLDGAQPVVQIRFDGGTK